MTPLVLLFGMAPVVDRYEFEIRFGCWMHMYQIKTPSGIKKDDKLAIKGQVAIDKAVSFSGRQ